jgi:glutathione S-transferase
MTVAPRQTGQRVLWGVGTSRTMRAHWALAELGLDYETRPIQARTGETLTPEFTALNARQKIPLLQDDGLVMTESAAIISYLSDRYGEEHNALLPATARERAQCMEWCFFVISELDATSLYVIRRHKYLKHVYGEAPIANDAAGVYFGRQMRSVERALSDGRRYLMGDRFGAADVLLSSCVTWAVNYQVAVAGIVVAYNERATAREAYAHAVKRNTPPADNNRH